MKRIITIVAMITTVFATWYFTSAFEGRRWYTHTYPAALYIADIHENKAAAVSIEKNLYVLEKGNWKLGDIVAAMMFDNGTPDKGDDVIVKFEYAGNIGVAESEEE